MYVCVCVYVCMNLYYLLYRWACCPICTQNETRWLAAGTCNKYFEQTRNYWQENFWVDLMTNKPDLGMFYRRFTTNCQRTLFNDVLNDNFKPKSWWLNRINWDDVIGKKKQVNLSCSLTNEKVCWKRWRQKQKPSNKLLINLICSDCTGKHLPWGKYFPVETSHWVNK